MIKFLIGLSLSLSCLLITGNNGFSQTLIGAKVTTDANIWLPCCSFPAVAFNQERYDTSDIHDNNVNNTRLTAPQSGIYLICGQIEFAANGNSARVISIILNGRRSILELSHNAVQPPYHTSMAGCTVYKLNLNDYLELKVFSGNQSLYIIKSDGVSPEFSIQLIGE